jgi:RadC-like JAB domain
MHIATTPHFSPECECFAVLLLNTRRRIKGHQLITIGTMDTILVHPREVFRAAIIAAAAAIVMMHNHPSGDYIQAKRFENGLHPYQVADKIGVETALILAWENGTHMPDEKQWQMLSNLLSFDSGVELPKPNR